MKLREWMVYRVYTQIHGRFEGVLSDTSQHQKTHRNVQEWSFWCTQAKTRHKKPKKCVSGGMTSQSLWEMNYCKSWMLRFVYACSIFSDWISIWDIFVLLAYWRRVHFSRAFTTCFLAKRYCLTTCQQPQSARNRYSYNVSQRNVLHKQMENYLENISQNLQPYMERSITPQVIVGISKYEFRLVCTFQD